MKPYCVILVGAATKMKVCFSGSDAPRGKRGVFLSDGRIYPDEMCGGPLYKKRIAYAEGSGNSWYVLSAKHGVWPPGVPLRYNDQTIEDMTVCDRAIWNANTCADLAKEMQEQALVRQLNVPVEPKRICFEFHASPSYCHPLSEMLTSIGFKVSLPMKGMTVAQQSVWYSNKRRNRR